MARDFLREERQSWSTVAEERVIEVDKECPREELHSCSRESKELLKRKATELDKELYKSLLTSKNEKILFFLF